MLYANKGKFGQRKRGSCEGRGKDGKINDGSMKRRQIKAITGIKDSEEIEA